MVRSRVLSNKERGAPCFTPTNVNHALLQAYNKKRSYYKTIIREKKTTCCEEGKGPVRRNPSTKPGSDPLYKHGRMVETF